MKKDIHPQNYRPVVFKDSSTGAMFLSHSTIETQKTIEYEGKEYPVYVTEITSDSHPFFTGKQKVMDTTGRIEKFKKKYGIQ